MGLFVAVPLAPGTQEPRLTHVDDIPVSLQQRPKLPHMAKHHRLRRLADAVHIRLISETHQQLHMYLPSIIEIRLNPLDAVVRDDRRVFIASQIKIHLGQLWGFRHILGDAVIEANGWIGLQHLIVLRQIGHVDEGFHPEPPLRIFQQQGVLLSAERRELPLHRPGDRIVRDAGGHIQRPCAAERQLRAAAAKSPDATDGIDEESARFPSQSGKLEGRADGDPPGGLACDGILPHFGKWGENIALKPGGQRQDTLAGHAVRPVRPALRQDAGRAIPQVGKVRLGAPGGIEIEFHPAHRFARIGLRAADVEQQGCHPVQAGVIPVKHLVMRIGIAKAGQGRGLDGQSRPVVLPADPGYRRRGHVAFGKSGHAAGEHIVP